MCVKSFKNGLVFSVITILCLVYAPQSKADHKEKYAIPIMQEKLSKLNKTQHHIRHSRHKSLEIEKVPDYFMPLVDMSCISHGMVKAPSIKNGKVVRYIHKKLPLTAQESEHKGFLVAMYTCLHGYEYELNGSFKMYCSKRKWIGKKPKCLKIVAESYELNDDTIDMNAGILSNSINCSHEFRKNCEQGCIIENGQAICICYTGYILLENKCIDINECDNSNIRKICKNGCVNTQGSYHCLPSDVSFEEREEYIDKSSGIHYVPDKIYDESIEDEESSGSGDYSDENYSEENNKNEDDEDYVIKFEHENVSYVGNGKEIDDVRPIWEQESTTANDIEIEENNEKNNIVTGTSSINFITTESYLKETIYLDKIENLGNKENEILIDKNKLEYENKATTKESDEKNKNMENENTSEYFSVARADKIDNTNNKNEDNIDINDNSLTTEFYTKKTTYSDSFQIDNLENREYDTNKLEDKNESSGKESDETDKKTENESTTKFFSVATVDKNENTKNKEEDDINIDENINGLPKEPKNLSATNKELENSDDFKFQIKAITPATVVHLNSEADFNQVKFEKKPNKEDSEEENYEEHYDENDNYYNEIDYKEGKEGDLSTTTLVNPKPIIFTTETHLETTTTGQNEFHKNNTHLIQNTYDRGDDDYYNEIDYDERNYNLETDNDNVINVLSSTSVKIPIESTTEAFDYDKEQHGDVTIITKNNNLNTVIKETNEEIDQTFTTPTIIEKNQDENVDIQLSTMVPSTVFPTEIAVSVVSDAPHDLTTENFKKAIDFEVDNYTRNNEVIILTSNKTEEYDESYNYPSTTGVPNVEIRNENQTAHENKKVFITYNKDDDYKEENYKNDYDEDNYSDYYEGTSTPSDIKVVSSTDISNISDSSSSTEDYQEENIKKNHNETIIIPNFNNNDDDYNDEKNEKEYEEKNDDNYDISTSTLSTSYKNVIQSTNSYNTTESSNTLEKRENRMESNHKNLEDYETYDTTIPTSSEDRFLNTTEENIRHEPEYKKEYDDENSSGINVTKFDTEEDDNNNRHENIPSHSTEDDYKEDYEENSENNNYDDNYSEKEYDDKEVKPTISSSNEGGVSNTTNINSLPCPDGFSTTDTNCEDINECLETNGNCSHECENILGSYRCLCPLGYTHPFENHHLCVDIDECIHQPCSHLCINEIGSFRCDCPENYYPFNQTTCLEVICSYDFIKLNNSIECVCPEGFILGKDNYTCEDIDECAFSTTHNCSQYCENVKGSFACSCEKGYLLQSDSSTCEDINECEDVDLNDCFQICDNLNGSFTCACFDGFEFTNGTHCQDINECAYNNGNCSHVCVNGEGFHECGCPDNYYLMDDAKNCKLLNPCEVNNGGCSNICFNENGSAICMCPDGYEMVNDNCILIDNCDINNGGCSHFCNHVEGVIKCSCSNTHILVNETHCEEIDPCSLNNGGCSHLCKSINTTIVCYCPETHILSNATNCIHKNYCMENNGNCSHICSSYGNGAICSCPEGYQLIDNSSCVKKDPCKINNGYCSHICIVTNEEIECQCPIHYKLANKTTCVEINMCETDNGGCSHDCFHDDQNNIKCGCPQNYELKDDKMCVEINPCLIDNGGCSHDCSYENKSIKCSCPENHILEEKTCLLTDPCRTENGGCSHICVNVYGEAFCKCPPGLKLINRFCLEVNPCAMHNGGCSHFCTNLNGTVKCSCPVGYKIRPNKRNCKEINYCRTNNGGCSHGCRNLYGSYECTCPNGYSIDDNNKTCSDINECLSHNGGCEQLCINLNGGHKCACREEYRLETNRRSCKPIYISKCPALVPPQNGNVKCLQTHPNHNNVVPVGTQCLIWCESGYKLKGESMKSCNDLGHWGNKPSYCISVSCPKLGSVARGYFTPESCTKARLFPGEMCSLKCNQGYKPSREFESITCLSSLRWSSIVSDSRLENACTQDTFEPFIRCPKGGSLTYTLPPGKNQMLVTIPKPDSNVDWWRYITSKPSWGMELNRNLPPGRTAVIYTARSPVTNNTVSCRLIISVVDKETPQVVNCPNNIEYKLLKNEYNKVIYWSEPEFTDNVEVVGIYKSREPGTKFGMGIHSVYYIAHDESGNQAKCYFTINIKVPTRAEIRSSNNDKAILICPHGIRYISKSSEMYKNEALMQEGCYWGKTRARKPIKEHSFEVHSKNVSSESRSKRYHPFYWYNRCC